MNINNIELGKNTQVFKIIKNISEAKIKYIFKELAKTRGRKGEYKVRKHKEELIIEGQNTYYSIMSFKFEEEPSFFIETDILESKYAFIILVEYDNYLFVLKKHINGLEKLLDGFIDFIDYEKFSNFKASTLPNYEKVSMGNMTISNAVIKARSYEALQLNGMLPMASTSRSVARNFRFNDKGNVFTITPSTSRISERSNNVDIKTYIEWCISLACELSTSTTQSDFINNFAKPITLAEILTTSKPIGILFHFEIIEDLLNANIIKLYKFNYLLGIDELLTENELKNLFQIFRKTFNIRDITTLANQYEIYSKYIGLGIFKINQKTISLKTSTVDNISIDINGEKVSIKDYINKEHLYSIVFDNPKYAFVGKYAFMDRSLLSPTNIKKILSICDDLHDFTNINSEKEKNYNRKHLVVQRRFPKKSLFYKIEEIFNNGILICDDMNDEWADHINITNDSISFIHSKYTKKDSYGASTMHDVISQALKNIGRVNSIISEYENKYNNKWKNNYENTGISRLRKSGIDNISTFTEISDALERVYSNPNSLRKIYLATPFFSKAKLSTELNNFATGTQTKNVHYFQMIWLLSAFISSCQDYGVQPYILCKK